MPFFLNMYSEMRLCLEVVCVTIYVHHNLVKHYVCCLLSSCFLAAQFCCHLKCL